MTPPSPLVVQSPLVGAAGVLTSDNQRRFSDLFAWTCSPWKEYQPACSAPGYTINLSQYREIEGQIELCIVFTFTGNGGYNDVGLSLPVAPWGNVGQFTCFVNKINDPLVCACAAIYGDGVIHITQSGAPNYPTGTIYCQLSGRYRAA